MFHKHKTGKSGVATLAFASLVAAGLGLSWTSSASPALAATSVRIGMSAPKSEWDARLRETGPVRARRLFGELSSTSGLISLAKSEIAAGRMPILSFKLPNNDWVGAAAGKYDAQLRSLATNLDNLPGQVFVTIHHEPTGDGTAKDYAAMQRRVLPILAPPSNVDAGVIVNGFWWSAKAAGYTDAEIAQWLPTDVLRLAEVIGADTYQGGTSASPGEDAGPKIRRLSQWATRVGVTRLGIGEYNGLNATAIKSGGDAILADPRFVFAAVFNSSENNREGVNWLLTGDRLTAFKNTLAGR